jgi:K+/H+ antiporter YhaU regulatory subunit KhtT
MISEGLNIFRSRPAKAIVGKTLREQSIREDTGCSVIAIKRGESMLINPDPDTVVGGDDELILIATAEAEKKFARQYQPPS